MFDTKKIADTYDQIGLYFSATRPKLSAGVISLIPKLEPKASVLDLGCGNGVLLTALPNDVDYLGLDFSQTLLTKARELHPRTNFRLADITYEAVWNNLPRFDFIAALAVFHHLPDTTSHEKLLTQIKNHLKPNGTVLISIWDLNNPKFDRYRSDRHLAIPFHGGPSRPFYAFEPNEIPHLANRVGLSIASRSTDKQNHYYLLQIA